MLHLAPILLHGKAFISIFLVILACVYFLHCAQEISHLLYLGTWQLPPLPIGTDDNSSYCKKPPHPNIEENVLFCNRIVDEHNERLQALREVQSTDTFSSVASIPSSFTTWARRSSWSFCSDCNIVLMEKFLPSFTRKTKCNSKVVCKTDNYVVPSFEKTPECF